MEPLAEVIKGDWIRTELRSPLGCSGCERGTEGEAGGCGEPSEVFLVMGTEEVPRARLDTRAQPVLGDMDRSAKMAIEQSSVVAGERKVLNY